MPSGVESLAALHRSWAVSRCLAEALSDAERPQVLFFGAVFNVFVGTLRRPSTVSYTHLTLPTKA